MRRIKKLLLMALLAVALLPSNAYASTMVGAYSAGYDADDVATEYLGFDTYMTLDQGLKTVIHNSSTSGGSGTTANPNYPYYAAFRNSLSAAFNYLPGSGNTWYSSYNGFGFADAVDKARADLAKAFRWWETNKEGMESGGGSGGGGVTDDGNNVYLTFDVLYGSETGTASSDYFTLSSTRYYINQNTPQLGTPVTVRLTKSLYQQITGHDNWFVGLYAGSSKPRLYIGYITSTDFNSDFDDDSGISFGLVDSSSGYKRFKWQAAPGNRIDWYENVMTLDYDSNTFSNDNPTFYSTNSSINFSSHYETGHSSGAGKTSSTYPIVGVLGTMFGSGDSSGGTYEPVEPDPLPPKNPQTPSDPVVPDPPETDDPVPSPDIDWGDTIITHINVTQTDPDYQPIINAISVVNQTLQQTQNLILALQNNMKIGFEELDNQIYNNFQALLAQNDSWWNWLHDAWETGAQQLELWGDWLNSTIEEIRDDFEGFENNLITWLQMIYNKMASGGGPTSKPDPIQDDGGFWDWWANIVDKILGMLPEAVTDFLSQLNRLKGVFPFSIPWDVSFILGLFSQPPETPVFDIDMDTHYWQWDAHIDLHQWDNAATIFRRCVLLVFAMQLAMWTPDVIRNLVDI